MNKAELVKRIAVKAELSQIDSKKALEAALEVIKETLAENESVSLLGFGTFCVSERPAREGFNPLTKEKIQIEAKKVVKFKAGDALAKTL